MSSGKPILSASLMCANALALEADLRALEEAQVDYLHLDIMDGNFVPNIAVGIDLVKQVKAATSLPLDAHLMVANPDVWVPRIIEELSPPMIAFHLESALHSVRIAQYIRDAGAIAGVAMNPGTPACLLESLLPELDLVLVMTVNPGYAGQVLVESSLPKITAIRRMSERMGVSLLIGVDGNVSIEHAPRMREAGADLFVCGSSSLFRPDLGILGAARAFRAALGCP